MHVYQKAPPSDASFVVMYGPNRKEKKDSLIMVTVTLHPSLLLFVDAMQVLTLKFSYFVKMIPQPPYLVTQMEKLAHG